LIEEYKGAFPTWLAPVQIQVIPVSLKAHIVYANDVAERLKKQGLRVEVDVRDEKIGYKIRETQTKKVPYALVLGDKEMEADTVNIRRYGEQDTKTKSIDDFVTAIKKDIESKSAQ